MKKMFAVFLSLVILVFSSVVQVVASQDIPNTTSVTPRSYETYYGSSYDVELSGIQCYCGINNSSVHAMTSLTNTTVSINSKSFATRSSTTSNGGGGNAGSGTTSTIYTAPTVQHTYQIHSAPTQQITVYAFLFRY